MIWNMNKLKVVTSLFLNTVANTHGAALTKQHTDIKEFAEIFFPGLFLPKECQVELLFCLIFAKFIFEQSTLHRVKH